MLNLLTQYLLQYRTVTIPQVGTIQLIQSPPQLDVADKCIQPPTFSAQLKAEEELTNHQVAFLTASLEKSKETVEQDLKHFGNKLYNKINGPGFEWNGFGRFDRSTQSFSLPVAALHAVTAERVIRENPDHQLLVGDRETTSLQLADEKATDDVVDKKTSIAIIIGWVLLLLSILAIAYFIYAGKFRVNASGSKMSATSVITNTGFSLNTHY